MIKDLEMDIVTNVKIHILTFVKIVVIVYIVAIVDDKKINYSMLIYR